jgi:hypothetical protein
VLAQNGLAFDLATSTDKLMCTMMAGIGWKSSSGDHYRRQSKKDRRIALK